MRIISRSPFYLKLLTNSNCYTKVSHRNLVEFRSQDIQKQYSQPIRPLEILEESRLVREKEDGQKVAKKKGKGKSGVDVGRNSGIDGNQMLVSGTVESVGEQKMQKESKKKELNKVSAKKSVKVQVANRQKKQEEKQQSYNEPIKIEQQFPALNYLKKALTNLQPDIQTSFNWSHQNDINGEDRQKNSQQFIQIISHAMSKESCHRVIKVIEQFCQRIQKGGVGKNKQKLGKQGKKEIEIQEQTFTKIKHVLEKELILSQKFQYQNSGNLSIDFFLNLLKNTNPKSITYENLEKNTFLDDSKKVPTSIFNFDTNDELFRQNVGATTVIKASKGFRNKGALEKALKLKSKIFPIKNEGYYSQNEPLFEVRLTPQNLLFRQVYSSSDKADNQLQSQKYAYIFDLPYGVTNEDGRQLVQYLQGLKHIKIVEYAMFPYKDLLSPETYEMKFNIVQAQDETTKVERIFESTNIDKYMNPDTNIKKTVKKQVKKKINVSKEVEEQGNGEVVDEQQYLAPSTDDLLNRIRRQDYSKFNRSAMIIKMGSIQEKKEIITHWTRLFGLNFKHLKNIKFQEAYPKNILVISGIPTGCTSTAIKNAINDELQGVGMRIDVDEDCYLTKKYIMVEFQSFVQTLAALKKLNNLSFQGKTLKTHLKYGPLQVFEDAYKSQLDSVQTWQKIEHIQQKYRQKYQEEDKIICE